MVWPPDSPWSPWWRTNRKAARAAAKLADIKPSDIVYELGSGDGMFVITAAHEYGARAIGIEIDPVRVFVSKIMVKFFGVSDKVEIIKSDFNKQNLRSASVVFMYLVPKALERLRQKLVKELKPNTRVMSFRYEFQAPYRKHDKKYNIYLYYASDLKFASEYKKK